MHKQGTQEWHEDRRGRLTASRMHRLMNGTYRGINTLLDVLQREIEEGVGGWLEGQDVDVFSMQWGTENESRAVALYEMLYDVDVQEVGMIKHPEFDFIGASPDGLIPNGSLEIKCPSNPQNHEIARVYGMPKKHHWQVQTQSLCLCNDNVVFMSFDPRVEPSKQLAVDIQPANKQDHEKIMEKAHWLQNLLQRGDRMDNPSSITTPKFF